MAILLWDFHYEKKFLRRETGTENKEREKIQEEETTPSFFFPPASLLRLRVKIVTS